MCQALAPIITLFSVCLILAVGCSPAEPATDRPTTPEASPEPDDHVTLLGKVFVRKNGIVSPLSGAIVYLSATEKCEAVVPSAVKVRLANNRFNPPLVGLVAGQTLHVDFTGDKQYHFNVYYRSFKPYGATRPPDPTMWKHTFIASDEIVHVKCTINPSFRETFMIVPNSVFTSSDEAGDFSLRAKLPTAAYEFRAFHPKHGRETFTVALARGKSSRQAVTIDSDED